MSESIAIHPHRPAVRVPGRAHHLLLGGLLGMLIGALGFAIAVSTVDVIRAALPGETAAVASAAHPVPEYPARALPREWREWNIGVDVDHMYRQQQAPKLDWIREGGRR